MWTDVSVRMKNHCDMLFLKSLLLSKQVSETWYQVYYFVAEDSTNSKDDFIPTLGYR